MQWNGVVIFCRNEDNFGTVSWMDLQGRRAENSSKNKPKMV